MAFITQILIIIVGGWLVWSVWNFKSKKPRGTVLPVLRFEGDNSLARYKAETWTLLERGYNEYLRKGQAFKIRNIANKNRPIVILPLKYLPEVRIAPQNRLSLPAHLEEVAIPKHVHGPSITEEVQHVARLDLNRALNELVKPLQAACSLTLPKLMPACSDFTSVLPYPMILQLFARMSARVMVGEDLAGDDWQALSLTYMTAILGAPRVVKMKYHPWLYWTAKFSCPEVKDVKNKRKACADFIAPTVQARQTAIDNGDVGNGKRPEDAIQWLIEEHRSRGRRATADDIVQNIFVTMVASIHSSAGTALSTLYDLLDHPNVLEEIREEILNVRNERLGGGTSWTRHALGELRLLDSVLRESLRLNSFTEVTVQRVAVKDYTFKDGLHIPRGTQISFASRQYSRDSDIYPDPEVYDPKRWLHKRQEMDWHGLHFPATSDDWINWGSGSHVCPGRFLADVTIKLIFIHLIVGYHIKYPEGVNKRPQDTRDNFSVMPDMTTSLLFKERS